MLSHSACSRSESRKNLAILFVAFLAFIVAVKLGLTASVAQVLVFPIVALFILRAIPAPKALVVSALVAGVVANLAVWLTDHTNTDTIAISQLQGDTYGGKTRKLASAFNEIPYREDGLNVDRLEETIQSYKGAREFFDANSQRALIYGSSRWINVVVSDYSSIEISKYDPVLLPLILIRSIPVFGLSLEPVGETSSFLTYLFSGLPTNLDSYQFPMDGERWLLEAATLRSFWTTNSHIAFSLWHLGNLHLIESIRGQYQPAELECALQSYRSAFSILYRPKTHPELAAAILNNYALAQYINRFHRSFPIKGKKVRIKKILGFATKMKRMRDPFGAPRESSLAAWTNISVLLGEARSVGKTGTKVGKKYRHGRAARKLSKNQRSGKIRQRNLL